MNGFSKFLRIVVVIFVGVLIISLAFTIFPQFGSPGSVGMKILYVFLFVLIIAFWIYNLVCLIINENIIAGLISDGTINFGAIGKFLVMIPKGIWWFLSSLFMLLIWPFKSLKSVLSKSKASRKLKNQQKDSNKNAIAEQRHKELTKKQNSKRYENKDNSHFQKQQKDRQRIVEQYQKAEKTVSEIDKQDTDSFELLKLKLKFGIVDYIKSISLSEATIKTSLAYSDSRMDLIKYIVTYFHQSGVTEVSAVKMFDVNKGKFVGSKDFPWVNTNIDGITDEETIKVRENLKYYVDRAENNYELSNQLRKENEQVTRRIMVSRVNHCIVILTNLVAKELGIERKEAEKLVNENGELCGNAKELESKGQFKELTEKIKENQKLIDEFDDLLKKDKEEDTQQSNASIEHESKILKICECERKKTLKELKTDYNWALKKHGQKFAETALVIMSKETEQDPDKVANAIGVKLHGYEVDDNS